MIIVIGGGHAGCEAAIASARIGVPTILITHKRATIGEMSCNPAIGGLGKGHLVREIDAMGGLMARAIDKGGMQFRMLNASKGPAVQGPRAQADRALYKKAVQDIIFNTPHLTIHEASVQALKFNATKTAINGVILDNGDNIACEAVIMTSGTFLNGIVHIGVNHNYSAGRMGDNAENILSQSLKFANLTTKRLKTGTPPRLDAKTIDFSQCEIQYGDENPQAFSFMNHAPQQKQVPCYITYTNQQTHEIIRQNLHLSAMYGGSIGGKGPRYCPSIEDKIVKFADKTRHQIFLEPEGYDDDTIYPNGVSTSLPESVQIQYINSIQGLENAKILRAGYAIEYDAIDSRCLNASLQVKHIQGLYCAGQINGTTGYEEAAAQGMVAGFNAALMVQGQNPLTMARHESYIGVMINDLITQGADEPYRMFTARAEYRLSLRADNADMRLTKLAHEIGALNDEHGQYRWANFQEKMAKYREARHLAMACQISPTSLVKQGYTTKTDGKMRTGFDLLGLLDFGIEECVKIFPQLAAVDKEILTQLSFDSLYGKYALRHDEEVKAIHRDQLIIIPKDIELHKIGGLNNELCEKLKFHQPKNLAEAAQIQGMTPAAMVALFRYIKQQKHGE